MILYMAVTPDKYELPLIVEPYLSVISQKLGIRSAFICQTVNTGKGGKKKGCRFYKVEVEDGDEDEL